MLSEKQRGGEEQSIMGSTFPPPQTSAWLHPQAARWLLLSWPGRTAPDLAMPVQVPSLFRPLRLPAARSPCPQARLLSCTLTSCPQGRLPPSPGLSCNSDFGPILMPTSPSGLHVLCTDRAPHCSVRGQRPAVPEPQTHAGHCHPSQQTTTESRALLPATASFVERNLPALAS